MIYLITMHTSVCAFVWVYASINVSNVTPFPRNWTFNNQTSAALLGKRWEVDPWSTQLASMCAKFIIQVYQLPCHCQGSKFETKKAALWFVKRLLPWWVPAEGWAPPSTSEYHIGPILPLPLEMGAVALNWSRAPGNLKSAGKLALSCLCPCLASKILLIYSSSFTSCY